MAKKRPEFNLPSTDKGTAPATDWVYKSEPVGETKAANPVVAKPIVEKTVVEKPIEPVVMPAAGGVAAREIVKTHSAYAAAAGFIPMPFVDVVAITGVQVKMIQSLCDYYELEFNEQLAKGLIASIAASAGATTIAYGAGRSLMKSIPVIGTIGAMATMPAAAYGATYAIGEVFAKHFANGGTLFNMKPAPAAA